MRQGEVGKRVSWKVYASINGRPEHGTMERIVDFILSNITWVIFALFMLSGLFGKSGSKKDPTADTGKRQATGQDNRPLAERMAERFGIPLEEMQGQPREQQPPQGRRSTITGNVQDNYPELFGGKGMFADRGDDPFRKDATKWGFDETEWGSTFEKNEQQWGGGFPDRKSSEPRIELPR